MSSKVITNKMRIIETPFSSKILEKGEIILASSSENGLLFTRIQNNEEYLFDIDDINHDEFEYYSPIYFPKFNILNNSLF